jgi:HAD superfamily hydrolase (TIGR01509 family)
MVFDPADAVALSNTAHTAEAGINGAYAHGVTFDYDTVLFDVDGTLIDSNGAHASAWTQALQHHGFRVRLEDVRRRIGMGGDKLLPAVAGIAEDSEAGKAVVSDKKAIFSSLLPALQSTPGARTLVEHLIASGVDLVIATSADDKELDAVLTQAGVADLFPTRTSKDDANESKPDPDIVLAALQKAQASPERTVMIGDTPYDIEAAERAGIACVALRSGGGWSDSELSAALALFDDPEDLLEAILEKGQGKQELRRMRGGMG